MKENPEGFLARGWTCIGPHAICLSRFVFQVL